MRRFISAVLLAAAVVPPGGPAAAAAAPLAITRESQRDLMVTIYNGNLGLVKDTREARLPAGMSEVQFADVAAQIDPTSVHLKSLTDPAGLRILEQNYEYDLLSAQKLLEKYVGKKVRLYQGNGTYLEATLLSTDGPVFDINGAIHMGHQGQIVFPALPENLVSKPTLLWLLRNAATAPQRVEASYLTGGITWKSDYVVILNAADDRADLTGWVTIDNKSGATYTDAALKLVAGDLNRAREDRGAQRLELRMEVAVAARVGRAAAGAGDLVPLPRDRLAGPARSGVEEEHGPRLRLFVDPDRTSRGGLQRQAGEILPRKVGAGPVVHRNGQVLGQLEEVGHVRSPSREFHGASDGPGAPRGRSPARCRAPASRPRSARRGSPA